ncbi:hypothetical protein N836_31380 [Leptolyngbya sp. Heron Island J]|uniref:hypothetical protein n=1 Tax=Leptolyngbya sp. Heron Island J TaxID=1385935 RepID=UPI0003B9B690|nr:hypothetical protein [Leptolyngbya sp. Heron Island J]ESA38444.1 hypothetical protein N836_31380 [Leptolyngbya sp. Heron Island J]
MPYSTAAINAAINAVGALLDVGSAGSPTAEFTNQDGSIVYLSQPLENDAFGAAVGGQITANIPAGSITGLVDGSAGYIRFKNRDGVVVDAETAAADAVTALIAVGAGNPTVEITNSDASIVFGSINLDATPFGAAVSGVATANSLPKTWAATATGTATHKRWKDGDGFVVGTEALASPATIESGRAYTSNSITFSSPGINSLLTNAISVTTGNSYTTNSITQTQPAS